MSSRTSVDGGFTTWIRTPRRRAAQWVSISARNPSIETNPTSVQSQINSRNRGESIAEASASSHWARTTASISPATTRIRVSGAGAIRVMRSCCGSGG
ncbi:MAG TPA: hypothetical protein VG247_20980 [Pseudonocardiaceae bacterium]|nr:hypothetical protein [Pseudonocardiaceae bacterium]